jgi:hypothetical protein
MASRGNPFSELRVKMITCVQPGHLRQLQHGTFLINHCFTNPVGRAICRRPNWVHESLDTHRSHQVVHRIR